MESRKGWERKVFVVKKNGKRELYNRSKIFKILNLATNENKEIANRILEIFEKNILHDNIKTKEISEMLFKVTLELISPLVPEIDEVARNLSLPTLPTFHKFTNSYIFTLEFTSFFNLFVGKY